MIVLSDNVIVLVKLTFILYIILYTTGYDIEPEDGINSTAEESKFQFGIISKEYLKENIFIIVGTYSS